MQKQSSEKTKHKIKSKNKNQSKTKNRPTDVTSKEYQVARAFLRERTLRLLSGIAGKKCEMLTIESTIVTGEFKGCDINVQELFIKNLQTPISSIPDAVVRDQDIVKICVPNILCDSE